ncbi:hypothetical protein EON63_18470 [archaeon]|nr:MAG: hypothetical protein EON63_18470 [archaeon]
MSWSLNDYTPYTKHHPNTIHPTPYTKFHPQAHTESCSPCWILFLKCCRVRSLSALGRNFAPSL